MQSIKRHIDVLIDGIGLIVDQLIQIRVELTKIRKATEASLEQEKNERTNR